MPRLDRRFDHVLRAFDVDGVEHGARRRAGDDEREVHERVAAVQEARELGIAHVGAHVLELGRRHRRRAQNRASAAPSRRARRRGDASTTVPSWPAAPVTAIFTPPPPTRATAAAVRGVTQPELVHERRAPCRAIHRRAHDTPRCALNGSSTHFGRHRKLAHQRRRRPQHQLRHEAQDRRRRDRQDRALASATASARARARNCARSTSAAPPR